jgi:hypothetical protein
MNRLGTMLESDYFRSPQHSLTLATVPLREDAIFPIVQLKPG